jgi:predicted HicB family RNase H-like nuclease
MNKKGLKEKHTMSAEKTTTATAVIATPLCIIIVLPICSFVVLFEILPMINIATGIPAYRASNSNIDGSATIIRTIYATASALKPREDDNYQNYYYSMTSIPHTGTALSKVNYSDGHNVGLIGTGISLLNSSRSGRRRIFRNNNDFDIDDKKIDNISARNSSSNKLIHSSFRIEQDILESLEIAAASKDISLSSLVNKVLKNYVNSEMYFEELGFILVSKNFLRKTFERLEQKHIEELGKEYGMTIAKQYISYFYPQVNADTLIQFLEVWFKRFQSWHHRIGKDNNNNNNNNNYNPRHYFTVNHDVNMNFSLALQSILAGLIEPIIKNTVEFTSVTPSTITFSFVVFRE